MLNDPEECSVGVFSYCEASVGNSNHINLPQNINLNNNFISIKNNYYNNNQKSNYYRTYENPVIDLTDSLSEIPEEIKFEQNSKTEINPSSKMAKYLENTTTEKMKDFSNKKTEYQKSFFPTNDNNKNIQNLKNIKNCLISENKIKIIDNSNENPLIKSHHQSTKSQFYFENKLNFLKKTSSEEEILADNGENEYHSNEENSYEYNCNNNRNKENLENRNNNNYLYNKNQNNNVIMYDKNIFSESQEVKNLNSIKYNNVDTQSYWYNSKKYSDQNKTNNYEKNNKINDEVDFNIIKTEENEDIEDYSNLNSKRSSNQTQNFYQNQTTSNYNNISTTKKTEVESQDQGIKILKTSINVFLEGSKSDLKSDDYIYDNSIKIIKYLSEGAQAKVYLGHIEEINKFVAIKRYSIIENDEDLIRKINAECEFIKSLDHPNIIKYYDIDINYRNNFTTIDLIMEYVQGNCLKGYVKSEDFIYLEKEEKDKVIKFIIKSVLNGLSYLHSNKIIHRDLKVILF